MTSHLLIAPMSSPQAFHDFVDIHGVHLGIPGISEVGLRKRDALEALRLLRQTSVPVLGGDVYSHNGHSAEPAYANWGCGRRPGEGVGDYAKRSLDQAEAYVNRYPATGATLFVLVVYGSNVR